jgi:O-succinylbenzoic acid--CoA ligase
MKQLPGKILVEGETFTPESLQVHCREESGNDSLPAWRRELMAFMDWFLDPDSDELMQGTSGTTGAPGRILLERDRMICSAERTIRTFGLKKGDRVLLCLPIRYIAGKMMVVRALAGGLDLVLAEPSGRPLEGFSGQVAFGAMVPFQLYESLEHGDPLQSIGKLLVGGGELHPELRNRLQYLDTPLVYESFAMTETYTHFALRRINGKKPDEAFRLLEGVEIDTDERGCLVVDVAGVTRGAVVTNDLVEVGESGREFRWLGRYDNLISSAGVKIIPEVLEEQISHIIGYPCLVLPEPDTRLGQRLVLLVESDKGETVKEVWDRSLRSLLPPYQVPKRIVVVPSLTRNSSFKPDRREAVKLL